MSAADSPASEPADLPADHAAVWPACRSLSSSPDADDRVKPGGQRGHCLGPHLLVGLAQDVPPLAVAKDHVPAAQVQQHRGADFAR